MLCICLIIHRINEYHKLSENVEDCNSKKELIAKNGVLTVLINRIAKLTIIHKFEGAKILIDTDDDLLGDIDLKEVVLLASYFIKEDGKYYLKILFENIK